MEFPDTADADPSQTPARQGQNLEQEVEAVYTACCDHARQQIGQGPAKVDSKRAWLLHVKSPGGPGLESFRKACKDRLSEGSWRVRPLEGGWICEAKCFRGEWWPLEKTIRFSWSKKKLALLNKEWFNFTDEPEKEASKKAYYKRLGEMLEEGQIAKQAPVNEPLKSLDDRQLEEMLENRQRAEQMQPSGDRTIAQIGPAGPRPDGPSANKRHREDHSLALDGEAAADIGAIAESRTAASSSLSPPTSDLIGFLDRIFPTMNPTAESSLSTQGIKLCDVVSGLYKAGELLGLPMQWFPQAAIQKIAVCLLERSGFNGKRDLLRFIRFARDGTRLEPDDVPGQLRSLLHILQPSQEAIDEATSAANNNDYVDVLALMFSYLSAPSQGANV